VNYRASKAEAEGVVREIQALGGKAVAIQANVSRREEVAGLFRAVEQEFGRLDILVNNAGEFFAAKFEDLTDEQWDGIMNVNLKSQFFCASGGESDHEAAGARADHQSGFARRFARLAGLHALLRIEGRVDYADPMPGAGARPGDLGERHCARHDFSFPESRPMRNISASCRYIARAPATILPTPPSISQPRTSSPGK